MNRRPFHDSQNAEEQIGHSQDMDLENLVMTYSALVYSVIKGYFDSESDIEECVSDVFVKFWRAMDRYDPERMSLKNYLALIARHTALDRYRKMMSRQEILPLEEAELFESGSVEETVLDHLEREDILHALEQLDQDERDIIIKRFYYYKKIKDIAVEMQCNISYVKNRIHRGKCKLKRILIQKAKIETVIDNISETED
ncbi:MAG TPA: hypothetical protein DD727_00135 [Clostridiales bacterium]|nr:hypothetical protein [Clostridiales bacterium]